jgi:hypothetical protein
VFYVIARYIAGLGEQWRKKSGEKPQPAE